MKVIVVGIANQRTTLPIGAFPVTRGAGPSYHHEIRYSVGGIAFAVARSLAALGNEVDLAAPLGEDYPTSLIDNEAYRFDLSTHLCTRTLARTPRSVVLYAEDGTRQVFNDLTDASRASFRLSDLQPDVADADITILASRRMTAPLAAELADAGLPFAVDLHEIGPHILDDAPGEPSEEFAQWVAPFLSARYLTMSAERVPGREQAALTALAHASRAELVIMTLGCRGCLLLVRQPDGSWPAEPVHVPASPVRITNTIGVGDAFFAVFLHELLTCRADPITAASRANTAVARLLAAEPAHGGIGVDRLAELLGPACAPRVDPTAVLQVDPTIVEA